MYCLFCDKNFKTKTDRDQHIAIDHWKIKTCPKLARKTKGPEKIVRVRLF